MKRLEITVQMNDEIAFKAAVSKFVDGVESDGIAIIHELRFIDLESPILVSGNRIDQFIQRSDCNDE